MLHTDEEIDFYPTANLSTRLTGLPFVVWISQRGNARHDVRVKVSRGPKAIPEEMVSVAIRPEVRVVAGELAPDELERLRAWVELNREVILKFWDGELFTDDALAQIKAIR
jgi:hypothetical protein